MIVEGMTYSELPFCWAAFHQAVSADGVSRQFQGYQRMQSAAEVQILLRILHIEHASGIGKD